MAATTYVLVPGAGANPAYWQRIVPLLVAAGQQAVAVDLANWAGATLGDQRDSIIEAAHGATDVVLVAQSMGGFSAPLACEALPVSRLILVNAMIPTPGETAGAWWDEVGQPDASRELAIREGRDPDAEFDLATIFLHDLPADLVAELMSHGEDGPADSLFSEPFPLAAWPAVPTAVLSGRDDRLFPLSLQRRVARDRLGLPVVDLPGGHLVALSQPEVLTEHLLSVEGAVPHQPPQA